MIKINPIALRARQNYLFEQYLENIGSIGMDELESDLKSALQQYFGKADSEPDPDKKQLFNSIVKIIEYFGLQIYNTSLYFFS